MPGRLPPLSALVKQHGVLTERALIDAVAGAPVRGSWWSHPRGRAIFQALSALREDRDVFLCKLLDGKQTYVHRRLWPALVRLRAEASLWPALSLPARRLLARVDAQGRVETTGRVRLELERGLWVVAMSRHTDSGAHAVELRPFASHFPKACHRAAARLTLAEAQAALGMAGPAPAPGRQLRSTSRPRKGAPRRPEMRQRLRMPAMTPSAPKAARATPQPLPPVPRKP